MVTGRRYVADLAGIFRRMGRQFTDAIIILDNYRSYCLRTITVLDVPSGTLGLGRF